MENRCSSKTIFGDNIKEEKTMKSYSDEESTLNEVKVGEKEENSSRPSSPNGKELAIDHKQVSSLTTTERLSMESHSRDSSVFKNQVHTHQHQDDQLKSAKAEMGEVREENEKLKLTLSQITKDYQSLQMHFHHIVQKEVPKNWANTSPTHQEDEEPEFVSLSLGRCSSEPKRDEKKANNSSKDIEDDKKNDQGLALGLDCRFNPSATGVADDLIPRNSFNESKEEEPIEKWPPGKSSKMVRSGDDDVLEQNPLKKTRVSVRAICNTPTMKDGCQWRKYGQKIAKGNPCPRAYYRCTVSPSCPVRKHVQRCAEDKSTLITTYEGTHNHPLPISAAAMAYTTSAAASMLSSASSTSQPGLSASATTTTSPATTTSAASNLHRLNFTSTIDSPLPPPFYFPNTTISTSQSHPTITLDLTTPTSSHFNRSSSSTFLSPPKYPSTCLDFSSSSSSWGIGSLSYGTSSYVGRSPPQELMYQPHMIKNSHQSTLPQHSMVETIAAATREITSNPSFRSALAAAITSFVGKGGGGVGESNGGGENSSHNVKWGETFPLNLSNMSTQNGIGCATSYLNRLSSSNSQQGNLTLLPHLFPFSTSKSPSVSPADKGEHIK